MQEKLYETNEELLDMDRLPPVEWERFDSVVIDEESQTNFKKTLNE